MAAALTSVMSVRCQDETVVDETPEFLAAQTEILHETVVVQNEVFEVVGVNVSTIGQDGTAVIITKVDTATVDDDDRVQITGTVQQIQMPEEYSNEVCPGWGSLTPTTCSAVCGDRQNDPGDQTACKFSSRIEANRGPRLVLLAQGGGRRADDAGGTVLVSASS